MTKTLFHGNKKRSQNNQLGRQVCKRLGIRLGRADEGFSLFCTLWVLLALSFVCTSALSAVKLHHDFVLRSAHHFYASLEQENEKWSDELQRAGFGEAVHAVD